MSTGRYGGRNVFGLVIALAASGCGTTATTPAKPVQPTFRGETVVVAAVGDADVLLAVIAQRGEWEASRGAACRVLDKPVELSAVMGADVLVFRGERMGDLVDLGALAVLPESLVQPPSPEADPDAASPKTPDADEPDALRFDDVIPAFREQVSKYGNDRGRAPLRRVGAGAGL